MTQLREPEILWGVAFVPLSRANLEAVVDLDDLHLVGGHNWHAIKAGGHAGHYAATWIDRKFTYMHRLILCNGGAHVDHIDGDGLNNRRTNLRPATPSQNGANSGPRGGTSAFKGVGWDKSRGLWVARIKVNRRPRWIGRFATEEEAARAYDAAAFDAWGDFAYLNFPGELVA